jgi:hypothetical protein
VSNTGDNAKTEAILKTSQASDQWNFFQAKSTKAILTAMHGDLLTRLSPEDRSADAQLQAIKLGQEARRYDAEKTEIQKAAQQLVAEATRLSAINDRCDQAALLLQVAVVVCSVAILAHSRKFWWVGIVLGIAGVGVGVTAYFL